MTSQQEYYVKENVKRNEFLLLKKAEDCGIPVPVIVSYDEAEERLVMIKIPQMNIADFYGDNFTDVPTWITDEIRSIVLNLYLHNIEYPDITGYNFIEYANKVWVIDFGDAKEICSNGRDPFVTDFINGKDSWNPRFK